MDLMPEASSAPPQARRRYVWRSLISGFLFLPLYLGSQIYAEAGGNPTIALIAGYAGLFALLFLLYEFYVLMRQLDELQQRIHVTALALGFGAVVTLMTILGMNLQLWSADALPGDLTALVTTMAVPLGLVFYYIALHIVKRRYE
ncbi:hypothetical protein [Hyphobacterium sp.]|uniref:hypothetical protein n=1 Tax=Hyphobacterium sp. TaxID=2004662 RepID=UPI003BAD6955